MEFAFDRLEAAFDLLLFAFDARLLLLLLLLLLSLLSLSISIGNMLLPALFVLCLFFGDPFIALHSARKILVG